LAIKVKDVSTAGKKFVARGSAAGADYTEGVRGAGADWQAATSASAETYAAGVQDAISRGAFAKGVSRVGGSKYESRASSVGARRFPEGIREAQPAWESGTGPYLQTIAGLTLPPRRPKGDPSNYARVQAVGDALRKRKLAG
jgi:hypothetical protein